MIVVVSDTSPVRCLVHLKRLDLLATLFGKVLIPPEVVEELADPKGAFAPIDARSLGSLTIQAPHNLEWVQSHFAALHRGETAALALAVEVNAAAILIDDAAGRAAAQRAGIQPVGLIGVLIRAKQRNLIEAVKPLLNRLVTELNFFVSAELRMASLEKVNEADEETR